MSVIILNSPSPCQNNGTCFNDMGNCYCLCQNGYIGDFCQAKNCCLSNPCQNNGICFLDSINMECMVRISR